MRALLAQLEPAAGDVDANAATVAAALAEHPDAELAVFPELFLTGYDPSRAAQLALTPADAPLPTVCAVAKRHGTALLLGFAERTKHGVANAVACIDSDGRWAGTYRKTHMFGATERAAFVPGDALCVVELAGVSVAPLICFDMEFPEPARAVSRAGAALIVTIAANMEPYGPDHALAARARALDNRRPHLYVNRVGEEAGLQFVGGSAAVASDGSLVAELGSTRGLTVVDLPLGGPATDDVDYLEHLRDDLVVTAIPSTSVQGGPR
ncbi:nitrilase-related carbon-nitrogen hydrolase [Conexibacter woesei]|uniref:Nitrilase/cyanide hydratase and apolipoprotein N-acyltransferase n=1 Tax=Conexibacter woesei (strain DSM 14684 / CCUG 47730 / CIP 108061 / JCM 11494 / NBRC 100937 / ID131577) TaxID=469383 RepID=D3FCF1_CONWI|nr:nitrilase-related carbon-nitrogen hydrolase [Conexibacter woesei]ADB49424.1 Nitrilase/cyanide hydratase and apolipoprotein N- acyltransferase [Conexibacter woesei DSM 14684]